eukprot:TRINITY_DN9793_c0_g1_i1.p1 TRINITY_DN9793_c0_g1~~TRINITY_DN9793_c0_g1_i1.p1  ORF type:complete len:684 (+),score=123.87 TRINITY_DN9793_c0_g1_i1:38-2053(+)
MTDPQPAKKKRKVLSEGGAASVPVADGSRLRESQVDSFLLENVMKESNAQQLNFSQWDSRLGDSLGTSGFGNMPQQRSTGHSGLTQSEQSLLATLQTSRGSDALLQSTQFLKQQSGTPGAAANLFPTENQLPSMSAPSPNSTSQGQQTTSRGTPAATATTTTKTKTKTRPAAAAPITPLPVKQHLRQPMVKNELRQPMEYSPAVPPSSSEIISKQSSLELRLDSLLKGMKFQQRGLIEGQPKMANQITDLIKTQENIQLSIQDGVKKLKSIFENEVLPPSMAHTLQQSVERFEIHSRQLQILREELITASSGQPVQPLAALVITKQPFPCTVKQSKCLDDPVELTLLTASKVDITAPGKVRAEMINEDYNIVGTKKKNSQAPVENNTETLPDSGIASFKKLKFPYGSRVKTVNLKFAAEVHLNSLPMRLTSNASKPFIVMTNHGQRAITEGKLLKTSTFLKRTEIPWALFANTLQLHYLRATKQDPGKPQRPLTPSDLQYLHKSKFDSRPMITKDDYDDFWKWFGKILYKIRNHQKHVLPLWTNGFIYGFLSRDDSDKILRTAKTHSFLIRFSDRCPGQFVIVYVPENKDASAGQPNNVKHYLVTQADIEQKHTLPDFLRGCSNLWYILQLVRNEATGETNLTAKNKDEALSPFYTRKAATKLPVGYTPQV